MFTDTHCHLYNEYYDNIDEIIDESVNNGVNRWINNGCDIKTNKEILDLIGKYDNMYGALGIHPENVLDYKEEDLEYIESNLNNKKIIAIGEIGLDFHYDNTHKNEQINLLESQLELAERYNLPVIIHSRDANDEVISILKKYQLKGVIHSFSGTIEDANTFINLGYLLGINGIITFSNSNLKDLLKNIPLNKILIETDSPYLAPVPYRGKQNSPKYIMEIAKFIANEMNIPLNILANITNQNIHDLFNI